LIYWAAHLSTLFTLNLDPCENLGMRGEMLENEKYDSNPYLIGCTNGVYVHPKKGISYVDTELYGQRRVLVGLDGDLHRRVLKNYSTLEETLRALPHVASCAFLFTGENHGEFSRTLRHLISLGQRDLYLFFQNVDSFKKSLVSILETWSEFPDFNFVMGEEDAILLGLILGAPVTPPLRAVVEIHDDCNLKCDFCWSHSPLLKEGGHVSGTKKGIDTHLFFEYLNELSESPIYNIEFCALGDPLYHPDIWTMIEAVKKKGIRLRISTNGALITEARARNLIAWGVDELSMNISAGDRDTYADIHNVPPKVFDQLKKSLLYLAKLRAQSKRQNPHMVHIHVLTEKNARRLQAMADFALECGADFVSFRSVWQHKDFLTRLELSSDTIWFLLRELPRYEVLLSESGIENNVALFLEELRRNLVSRGESAAVEVNLAPARFQVQTNFDLSEVPFIETMEIPARNFSHSSWKLKNRSEILEKALTKIRSVDARAGAAPAKKEAPCVVSYNFSLLDSDHNLRYCCHGERVHEPYVKVKDQWASAHYQSFRDQWQKRFREEDSTCLGCPHLEENRAYGDRLKLYGLSEYI